MTAVIKFYARVLSFSAQEELSTLGATLGRLGMFPFFLWLLCHMWAKFSPHGVFDYNTLLLYVGCTEVLHMNSLRTESFNRAASDFSLSLARPRSWLSMQGANVSGRTLAKMTIQMIVFVGIAPALGASVWSTLAVAKRFVLLLPILVIVDTLLCLLLASGKVCWENIVYFRLPLAKIFLVFGGVLAPICDLSEPWRHWLLFLPTADVVFQPAYFAVKGEFYGMSMATWCFRVFAIVAILTSLNFWIFSSAKRFHQSYGG